MLFELSVLSLDVPVAKHAPRAVLQQLGSLPLLQQLALRADLLCSTCYPGALNQLQLLLASAQDANAAGNSSHTAPRAASVVMLQLLIFMHGTWTRRERCRCRHHDTAAFAGLAERLAGSVWTEANQQLLLLVGRH